MLYVFVVIEHATRRLLHVNVTTNPGSNWTLQQLREAVGDAETHSYIIHDRDSIFSKALDDSMKALGLRVLRTPVASPRANSICERVIGTIRRECLDWMIPMSEKHLRAILAEWVTHYNRARVHKALGPGVPDPPKDIVTMARSESRHRLAAGTLVLAKSVLGGLHHEYSVAAVAASV
jgi:transposase InsO family protein